MKRSLLLVLAATLGPLGTACGEASLAPPDSPGAGWQGHDDLTSVLDDFRALERNGDLSVRGCDQLMGRVERLPEALLEAKAQTSFDVGLMTQRCGRPRQALDHFRAALAADPSLWQARVALARGQALDPHVLVPELSRAMLDSEYTDKSVMVDLARAQLARRSPKADSDGADDFARAERNLKRALVLDDAYMPALDELARLQLDNARRAAGVDIAGGPSRSSSRAPKIPRQSLDLALLSCTQAIAKDATYAPIHATLGLVLNELGDLGGAARAFDHARTLDKKLFEAHLGYAAINLSFRGFDRAEDGYRAALELAPDDYDAALGLALALRGQADDAERGPAKLAEAERVLVRLEQRVPTRPEAFFNHAVLLEMVGAKGGGPASLRKAREAYERFVEVAKGHGELTGDVSDVTAEPTRSDAACAGEPADAPGCKRGRLYDLKQQLGEPTAG